MSVPQLLARNRAQHFSSAKIESVQEIICIASAQKLLLLQLLQSLSCLMKVKVTLQLHNNTLKMEYSLPVIESFISVIIEQASENRTIKMAKMK